MIATIKAEWRKNRFRPAFVIASGLIGAITVLLYTTNWYLATHPGSAERSISLTALYPDQFVNSVLGAGFPLGAALAIVLGAIVAGSEYSWGTMKTLFTQRPGRLTTWAGRVLVFVAWMFILTAILFALGAAYSAVIAAVNSHTITWPAGIDIVKGFAAVWLIFVVNGAIGLTLGTLIRQSAAALGVGLVYLLSVELIAVRFIDSVSNGAYKWVGDLLVGQNAIALVSHLRPNPAIAPTISAEQAVVVMFVWLAGLLVIGAGLQRMRDVT